MTLSLIGQAQPERYTQQLTEKQRKTEAQFQRFYRAPLDVFASPPSHFRMRAEFKIWHDGDDSSYAMYEPGKYKSPVVIEGFSIGSQTINALMPQLLERINTHPILRNRLFQVEFLTTLSGEALITLIYHKALDEAWEAEARALQAQLSTPIIGRSKKQKCVLDKDYVTESFELAPATISYQQVETGFTQPNAAVCKNMLDWAYQQSLNIGGDLLELYCGNGNFTLPLSYAFDKVLATEVSKISTRSALHNIAQNKRENIEIVRLSAEEVSEAFSGSREFRRLKHIDFDSYAFSTVFVDPPRAGLDDATVALVADFDNIIYISCNPDTLEHNLEQLSTSHSVQRFALFDQFPYTDHRECGVILRKLQ